MTSKEQKRTRTLLHCTDPKEDFYASIHHQHEPPHPVNYVVLGPLGQARFYGNELDALEAYTFQARIAESRSVRIS